MVWSPVEAARIEDAWLCLVWGVEPRDRFYVKALTVLDAEFFDGR